MKNVFFALAFMLVGTLVFASNSVETELNVEETVELVNSGELAKINVGSQDIAVGCCTASGGGIKVTVCKPKGACTTAGELLDQILD